METCGKFQCSAKVQENESYDDDVNNKSESDNSIKKSNIRKDSVFLAKRRMAKDNKQSDEGREGMFPHDNHSTDLEIPKSNCNVNQLEPVNFEETYRTTGEAKFNFKLILLGNL